MNESELSVQDYISLKAKEIGIAPENVEIKKREEDNEWFVIYKFSYYIQTKLNKFLRKFQIKKKILQTGKADKYTDEEIREICGVLYRMEKILNKADLKIKIVDYKRIRQKPKSKILIKKLNV